MSTPAEPFKIRVSKPGFDVEIIVDDVQSMIVFEELYMRVYNSIFHPKGRETDNAE